MLPCTVCALPLHVAPYVRVTCAYRYDSITKGYDGAFQPARPSLILLSALEAEAPVLSYPFMSKALEILNDVYAITGMLSTHSWA